MWEVVAGSIISGLLSGQSNSASYTPNKTWLSLQESLMKDISSGLEAGGYTWDDATNALLKRSAVESAASPYKGAQERVVSSLAPYGNVGAMGRGLISLNTARASDEASALRNVDIAREQQKLGSYGQLMSLATGIGDPNMPSMQTGLYNASNPSSSQVWGNALATGLGTYMNLSQAQSNNDFWNKYLASK